MLYIGAQLAQCRGTCLFMPTVVFGGAKLLFRLNLAGYVFDMSGMLTAQQVCCTLQLVTCNSPAGKLGVTVCYDLRFPEMYQLLAWHMGAQILLVPSAFTVATGKCCSCCLAQQNKHICICPPSRMSVFCAQADFQQQLPVAKSHSSKLA